MTAMTLRVIFVVVVVLGPSMSSFAQERTAARLQYTSGNNAGCPDEQGFRDIVAGRLGYDPFENEAALTIEATVTYESGSFLGIVRVIDAGGTVTGAREIEAPQSECTELATSMAIAISILLDPFGAASQRSQPEPEPGPAPEPAPTPEAAPSAPRAEPPPPEPDLGEEGSQIGFALHGGLAGGLGLTPGFTLGPRIGMGLRIDAASILLEGRVDFMPTEATVKSGDRLEATLFSAGPTGCLSFGVGLACIGFQFGTFQGRGLDVVDSRTQTSFFAAAEAAGGVEVLLGDVLFFRALAELRVPIVRTSLSIDGATVWNAPPLGAGLGVGLGANFL